METLKGWLDGVRPGETVTVITSKPSWSRGVGRVLKARRPDVVWRFVHTLYIGLYRPKLPSHVPWSDYPRIEEPGVHGWTRVTSDQVWEMGADGWTEVPGLTVLEQLKQSDHVWRGAEEHWAQAMMLALVGRDSPGPSLHWLLGMDFDRLEDPAWCQLAWRAPHQDPYYNAQRIKAYFDYNFAVNSLGILGRTFEQPGQPTPWVSKYQVQLLFAARLKSPQSEGQWIDDMSHWRGTGKYPQGGLGSVASRAEVLRQLKCRGWFHEVHPKQWAISPEGQRMLRRLHPRCEDADLPMRLENWMTQNWSEAKPQMDRYLRQFFGRQKRWLATNSDRAPWRGS